MADIPAMGMPLLSGPPPPSNSSRAEISCRKCNKEFNLLFTRSHRCNHCGYSYCSSCSDYQALMPRTGPDTGYEPVTVCTFCIGNLTITAGGRNYLKSLPLARLKKYADAYNINTDGILEKDELIARIVNKRSSNGCLPRACEEYYRRNSVPNRQTARPRSLFDRTLGTDRPPASPPATPVPRRPSSSSTFARPDLEPSHQNPPPHSRTSQPGYAPPPGPPPTQHAPRPQYPPPPRQRTSSTQNPHTQGQYPPYNPHTRPNTVHPGAGGNPYPNQRPPQPSRPASAGPRTPQPTTRPSPPPPVPTLEQLLTMTDDDIAKLTIGTLKNVLFQNHVNATLMLEKSELVGKVMRLVEAERTERREREEEEERERLREEEEAMERQRVMMAQHRERQEREAREREEREKREREAQESTGGDEPPVVVEGEQTVDEEKPPATDERRSEETTPTAAPSTPPKPKTTAPPVPPKSPASMAAHLERTGLCVICQDEEANIAIVDCGHLAMCRGCSDLIMGSTRECPLCRTRIVTEARLLRIFKS
ncbi:uncharacterized protein STEHIDRAFT_119708 [Stereum hirsutum FP-91666 SS1]|uniref:uncharacterized protein n=1 Tax=Stereum hirsutum (strain FP-91666) TaxID=721885 RepID=UPI000440AE9C|nr:uncharacterized protein STEHIDRAFT_119708 [Stereum hirsutum FP-91666 SS1]EIM88929.1 hypothetical protein STEHIDRAFT_119708 [Stereum hirsutum FP-91666 SS1]